MKNKKRVKIFDSVEQENREVHRRRARLNLKERIFEFPIIQERVWGKDWTHKPIEK